MLTYTLNKLLVHSCEVERDMAEVDELGGETKAERTVVASSKCLFSWWREGESRSPSKEFATANRAINFTGGVLLLPLGTNIEDGDWVKQVTDQKGEVISGPFRVVAVAEVNGDHIEAALMRP